LKTPNADTNVPTVPEDVLKVARDVELAAYNKYQPETSPAYKSKVRSLYMNLKNKSNPQLRIRVFNGSISPTVFVVMKDDEMRSEDKKAEDEALMKENMKKAMVAQEEKSVSTQLKCGKCHQRKVSYTQAQTRSADEPMTTFCECLNCGNRWKFS
jgi:transcription elongation factor S-II